MIPRAALRTLKKDAVHIKLLKIWRDLRSSYWFVPSIMAFASFLLAGFMTRLDASLGSKWLSGIFFVYLNQPDGARSLLSTVAGSMITVAGVTFSITMVALSLASQQFGPRLLRNFMRDTGNQVVLGTFIATFLYCLLVLRTVRTIDENSFVPHLAILFAVVLAIFSLGVFIYFIHHTAQSIQVSSILAKLGQELKLTITEQTSKKHIFPEELAGNPEKGRDPSQELESFAQPPLFINPPSNAYLQAVDYEKLMSMAKHYDIIIVLRRRPGQFVYENKAFVEIFHKNLEALKGDFRKELVACFVFGIHRTHVQDIEFLFNQITEIALRALSPGINDPFTARSCIQQSTAGFLALLNRNLASDYRLDKQSKLRVIAPHLKLEPLFVESFAPIRHFAKASFLVNQSLLESYKLLYESSENVSLNERIQIEAKDLIEDACKVLSSTECNDLAKLYKPLQLLDSSFFSQKKLSA